MMTSLISTVPIGKSVGLNPAVLTTLFKKLDTELNRGICIQDAMSMTPISSC